MLLVTPLLWTSAFAGFKGGQSDATGAAEDDDPGVGSDRHVDSLFCSLVPVVS
jgi:hypothetical protein